MINIDQYTKSIKAFSQMDLNCSWVSFSQKQVRIGGVIYDICLPQVEQKPYKIIRLIKRIFGFFFGGSNYLIIAKSLNRFTQDIAQILPDDRVDLMGGAQQNSISILGKLGKAESGRAGEFKQFDASIREMFIKVQGEQNHLQDLEKRANDAESLNRRPAPRRHSRYYERMSRRDVQARVNWKKQRLLG